ncbi:hypothetical protein LG943_12400 [Streptomonospora sp. S1-112]|uniref:GP-PDE domain-containing protein n=1 Tax=Streptomonospora mangrovi TaxID=2883123 RepID=A0A9X3NQU1_9ACTN|nr:glycerophosphodiester phosphodiesterase family protein [Streptomonospora mangrovi]MDA0565115.1 hypothetical protein [Streptomonospora mangrovi]
MPETPSTRRPRRVRRLVLSALVLLVVGTWLNNTALLAPEPGTGPGVLAHRGLGQTFDPRGVAADTCTAERMDPPEHGYLENTVAGMRAAFDAGADQVEFDVHRTADDRFAVFHDWEVDCRTEASGTTRDFTLEELRRLDIGHGYTADGGRTHPFRGEGRGLMPSLDEVLAEFPDRELLIHVKSEDPEEGVLLAERLARLPRERLARITVYGGDRPVAALREELPRVRSMSRQTLTDCLIAYEALGWTGHVPDSCAHTQLHIPEGYAPWLWGWPARFTERMASVDTRVVLVAGSGGFSEGFDTPAALERVPDDYAGLVWTNRVDRIAPLVAEGAGPGAAGGPGHGG